MSISSVSTSQSTSQAYMQNDRAQFKQDFQDLSQALQSGDMSAAQDAMSKIQQLQQNKTGGTKGAQGAFSQDLETLASAISSGDLEASKNAFSTLQQNMQTHKGGHHHSHSSQGAQTMSVDSRSGASAAVYA